MDPFFRIRTQKLRIKKQLVQSQVAAGSSTETLPLGHTISWEIFTTISISEHKPIVDTATNSLDKARNKVTKRKQKVSGLYMS